MKCPMKDGGSAFPVFEARRAGADYDLTDCGMTLRDWFAGQALDGVLANGGFGVNGTKASGMQAADYAGLAYIFADAMIARREKKEEQ